MKYTREIPFKYEICDKVFSQSWNLKIHTRTLISEKLLNVTYILKHLLVKVVSRSTFRMLILNTNLRSVMFVKKHMLQNKI